MTIIFDNNINILSSDVSDLSAASEAHSDQGCVFAWPSNRFDFLADVQFDEQHNPPMNESRLRLQKLHKMNRQRKKGHKRGGLADLCLELYTLWGPTLQRSVHIDTTLHEALQVCCALAII